MNFLNRAWNNVTRKYTKSILLAITFFMIGNLVILGLGVSQAAENAKILTRQKMKAIVTYEVDYQKYYEYVEELTDQTEIDKAYKNFPKLDKDIALKLSQDKRVKTFNYLKRGYVYSSDFEHVPLGNDAEKQDNSYYNQEGKQVKYTVPNIMLIGNLNSDMVEFQDGTNKIVEGRFYTQQEIDNSARVAVISKDLADLNNLKVGSTINIDYRSTSDIETIYEDANFKVEDFRKEFEVIGIYTTTKEIDTNSAEFKYMQAMNSPKNAIYTTFNTISNDTYDIAKLTYDFEKQKYPEMEDINVENYFTPEEVVYLLDDPLNVDAYVKENSNLPEYTKLNANNETFKNLAKPLDTLSFFANIIVIIVTANAVVIISLITALTLKTREFEIGVLLSLGVSKFKVLFQLFMELLIVAVLGFTLAIISGSLVADSVGKKVLEFQQSQSDNDKENDNYNYFNSSNSYFTEVSQEELFSEYKVSVSPIIIIEIYILGMSVVFISILIPSVMIMRLNPKQILLSTN